MSLSRSRFPRLLTVVGAALALTLAACSSGSDSTDSSGASGAASAQKIAAIFSGPTTDADYNSLGLLALEAAKKSGAQTNYAEKVAVPDVEARINEFLADGSTLIWTHGSQFFDATAKAASANPDVTFIGEFDGKPADQPANLWVIDRQFHLGFYGVGVLAGQLSKSGTIGYVGGLSLPFSYAEVHAMQQALADSGSKATLKPVWTGDFNDVTKAQQFTTQLLGSGADVIVGSLNAGAQGTFKAFEGRPAGEGWVTAKYTDKSSLAGDHYAGSVLYDFTQPLSEILGKVESGTRTGYYPLGFDTGVSIQTSAKVPAEAKKAVDDAIAKVKAGDITVKLDTSKVS